MILHSKAKLDKIHRTRKAVNGELYQREDGFLFIGNAEGFLERSKVTKGSVTGNTLSTELDITAPEFEQGGDITGIVSNAKVIKVQNTPIEKVTSIGNIWVFDGTNIKKLAVGANGTVLIADSTLPLGVKWGTSVLLTDTKTIQGARSRKVTNSYLESDGVFMNLVPVITEKEYTLKSITMASETSNTWTVEIRDNGVLIPSASLTVTAGLNNEASGLNIAIPIGSKLMFYVNGTLVQQPRVIITLTN